ncbi:MAG: hypothetical protein ACYDH5_14560, partial [Acidimicrobiales bacterium]
MSSSTAGSRVAFLVGHAEIVAALTKLDSYLDSPGHRRDGLRTGSRPAGGMSEHFARLASRYDALRRTDCAPVAA